MDNGNPLRSSSPNKRRRKEDDSLPRQSALRTGIVLTATGSAKQTSSSNRHLTDLRSARLSISLSPITIAPKPLSGDAITRLRRLRKRLCSALMGGLIPGGLKNAIKQDPDFRLSVSIEPINNEAYNHKGKRTPVDFALINTTQQVKRIFQGATLCTQFKGDENA
ncbi:hypothetical protein K432DRAFT_409664 [Lepidopterella palustris CBS 459.81]|uniref:Uncharacterized protein n=1 Tax=Lepidopterella palustris CBS 459.81 TaxID=1314670 RepID=A0A8E2DZT4_9PEZI|nr:hypothetical protein K432DRAFT_409664 [Lepidopterella palustris CBS 459.81]